MFQANFPASEKPAIDIRFNPGRICWESTIATLDCRKVTSNIAGHVCILGLGQNHFSRIVRMQFFPFPIS